jgi:hypothetical protein
LFESELKYWKLDAKAKKTLGNILTKKPAVDSESDTSSSEESSDDNKKKPENYKTIPTIKRKWNLKPEIASHPTFLALEAMFKTEPEGADESALAVWREKGCFRLDEMIAKGKIVFNPDLILKRFKTFNSYTGQVDALGKKCGIGREIFY